MMNKPFTLYLSDCLEKLAELPENSVDSIVTDPPAGIGFMGKKWDRDKGGKRQWIDWMEKVATECLRVLKPGGHALVWSIPRTSHWTATAWEDAGFEVRDCIYHHFGSGFPKGANISKNIDKAAGAEREVVGIYRSPENTSGGSGRTLPQPMGWGQDAGGLPRITAPATDAAKQWDGWGTALKPATEHWILVRKPLSEKAIAANVLKWGCGAINIDGCRVTSSGDQQKPEGRWPANLVLQHHPECVLKGTKRVKGITGGTKPHKQQAPMGGFKEKELRPYFNHADAESKETVENWDCHEDCPIGMFPVTTTGSLKPYHSKARQSNCYGKRSEVREVWHTGDSGSAARFFKNFPPEKEVLRFCYQAKASKSDRNEGLEETEDRKSQNFHPTVKSTELMRYLCRLITPPGGIVLDPFMGSGSTGKACVLEGFRFIGIEIDYEYFKIARQRIKYSYAKSQ